MHCIFNFFATNIILYTLSSIVLAFKKSKRVESRQLEKLELEFFYLLNVVTPWKFYTESNESLVNFFLHDLLFQRITSFPVALLINILYIFHRSYFLKIGRQSR